MKCSALSTRLRQQSNMQRTPQFKALWRSFTQRLLDALTREPEPKVWQRTDRTGQTWWQVYDPSTGRSDRLSSELEVRYWLERRCF